MESEPTLTPKEKSSLREKKSQRRMEPTSQHQAGRRAQHTTNELFRPQLCHYLDYLWAGGKASASRAGDPEFGPLFFCGLVIPCSDLNIGTLVATLPGATGSALGLVGPVPVYCDWVRQQVGSSTSLSVWQRVHIAQQTRPSVRLCMLLKR